MKLYNSYKIFVFLLIASLSSIVNGQNTNAYLSKIVTVEDLTILYDTAKYRELKETFNEQKFSDFPLIRVKLDNNYFLKGKLLGYHKNGLFLFDKSNGKICFVNYKIINKVFLGRTYGHFYIVASLAISAAIGLIASYKDDAFYGTEIFSASLVVCSSYGHLAFYPTYLASKNRTSSHWKIFGRKQSFHHFYEFLKVYPNRFHYIKNYTEDITPGIDSNINEPFIVSSKPTQKDIVDSSDNSGTTSPKSSEAPNNVSTPVFTTIEKSNPFDKLEYGKNASINAAWILVNFDGSKVSENTIVDKYKNISGILLTPSELKKYNQSTLQYLAMIICTYPGYDFKSTPTLTQNQIKVLAGYEPMMTENVSVTTQILKTNLDETADKNLQVIFDVLRSR